jgi:hypothetical protein
MTCREAPVAAAVERLEHTHMPESAIAAQGQGSQVRHTRAIDNEIQLGMPTWRLLLQSPAK